MSAQFDISIVNGGPKDRKCIYSTHPFFRDEVVLKAEGNRFVISRAGIGWQGKIHKASCLKERFYIGFISDEIPMGHFNFDQDESNEDMKVVILPMILSPRIL